MRYQKESEDFYFYCRTSDPIISHHIVCVCKLLYTRNTIGLQIVHSKSNYYLSTYFIELTSNIHLNTTRFDLSIF